MEKELKKDFWLIMNKIGYKEGDVICANEFWPVIDQLKKKYAISYSDEFEARFNFILTF